MKLTKQDLMRLPKERLAELLVEMNKEPKFESIRKDALLEWLENKVSLSYGVATDALAEVIDKINSM